jgi:predicted ferric reductase
MPLVKKYFCRVKEVSHPLPDLYTVTFSSDKKYSYLPGQFLHLAINDYDGVGQWPDSRCFSMQSNPSEEYLKISYTVKGNFTKKLEKELKAGKEVWLKLPYGDVFQRDHLKTDCVFIAGGTGITPFISLFTDCSFEQYVNPVLYFGIRSEKYNIFESELEESMKVNKNFQVKIVDQSVSGNLSIDQIFANFPNSTFFLSGPPMMIKNFKNFLLDHEVPMSKIISDDWE